MTELIDSFSWSQVFRATMVLFAVIDIIGSIPLIIKVQEKSGYVSPMRTSVVSFGIMLGFLILGESILNIFGVDIRSFAVAGSIIIFALAGPQFGSKLEREGKGERETFVAFFPVYAARKAGIKTSDEFKPTLPSSEL